MDFDWHPYPGVFGSDFYYQKLRTIRQLSTVARYKDQFQFLQSLVSVTHPAFDEEYFAACCLNGLKEDIRKVVQLFRPVTVSHVISLAECQELILVDEAKKYVSPSAQVIKAVTIAPDLLCYSNGHIDNTDVGGCVPKLSSKGADKNIGVSSEEDDQEGIYDLNDDEWQQNFNDSKANAAVDVTQVVVETLVVPIHNVSDPYLKNSVEDSSGLSSLWTEVGIERVALKYNLSLNTSEGDHIEEESAEVSHQVQQIDERPPGIYQPGTSFFDSTKHLSLPIDEVVHMVNCVSDNIPGHYKSQSKHLQVVSGSPWKNLYSSSGSETNALQERRSQHLHNEQWVEFVHLEHVIFHWEPGLCASDDSLLLYSDNFIFRVSLYLSRYRSNTLLPTLADFVRNNKCVGEIRLAKCLIMEVTDIEARINSDQGSSSSWLRKLVLLNMGCELPLIRQLNFNWEPGPFFHEVHDSPLRVIEGVVAVSASSCNLPYEISASFIHERDTRMLRCSHNLVTRDVEGQRQRFKSASDKCIKEIWKNTKLIEERLCYDQLYVPCPQSTCSLLSGPASLLTDILEQQESCTVTKSYKNLKIQVNSSLITKISMGLLKWKFKADPAVSFVDEIFTLTVLIHLKSSVDRLPSAEKQGTHAIVGFEYVYSEYEYSGRNNVLQVIGAVSRMGLHFAYYLRGDFHTGLNCLLLAGQGKSQVSYTSIVESTSPTIFQYEQLLNPTNQWCWLLVFCLSFYPQGNLVAVSVHSQRKKKYGVNRPQIQSWKNEEYGLSSISLCGRVHSMLYYNSLPQPGSGSKMCTFTMGEQNFVCSDAATRRPARILLSLVSYGYRSKVEYACNRTKLCVLVDGGQYLIDMILHWDFMCSLARLKNHSCMLGLVFKPNASVVECILSGKNVVLHIPHGASYNRDVCMYSQNFNFMHNYLVECMLPIRVLTRSWLQGLHCLLTFIGHLHSSWVRLFAWIVFWFAPYTVLENLGGAKYVENCTTSSEYVVRFRFSNFRLLGQYKGNVLSITTVNSTSIRVLHFCQISFMPTSHYLDQVQVLRYVRHIFDPGTNGSIYCNTRTNFKLTWLCKESKSIVTDDNAYFFELRIFSTGQIYVEWVATMWYIRCWFDGATAVSLRGSTVAACFFVDTVQQRLSGLVFEPRERCNDTSIQVSIIVLMRNSAHIPVGSMKFSRMGVLDVKEKNCFQFGVWVILQDLIQRVLVPKWMMQHLSGHSYDNQNTLSTPVRYSPSLPHSLFPTYQMGICCSFLVVSMFSDVGGAILVRLFQENVEDRKTTPSQSLLWYKAYMVDSDHIKAYRVDCYGLNSSSSQLLSNMQQLR